MTQRTRKQRVPQLKYTEYRGIGWHVSYRDSKTGLPRKHRFGMVSQGEAERAYHTWVAAFLGYGDETARKVTASVAKPGSASTPRHSPEIEAKPPTIKRPHSRVATAVPGSIAHIASGLLRYEADRARKGDGPRASGTISPRVLMDRKKAVKDFLAFLNERHGEGAAGRMRLEDLSMGDIEAYNREMVEAGI